ncbi:MAG: terminase small subunit [Deltaproteobacteria bacterium]|nr:terminase small subunit [Deltaproteobacteria bacterium]
MGKKDTELTPKQLRFVEEYQIDLNATQAAIRTGYSEKTATSQASRLLTNVKVQEALTEGVKKKARATGLSAQWVLERLEEVAERCMTKEPVMVWEDGEKVPSGEFKFDSSGANKALGLIGKHFKMFTEKVEVEGKFSLEQLVTESREDEG